jgi:subtilisin family serine protease
MTLFNPSDIGRNIFRSALVAFALLVSFVPTAAQAGQSGAQSYVVVMKGAYALDGSYALGQGYALVGQNSNYALDNTKIGYALGQQYALYALNRTYALLDQYALTDQFDQDGNYRQFGEYALRSGYALDTGYALGQGYALASQSGTDVLDSSYALTSDTAAKSLGDQYALLDEYALGSNYALARDYALYALSVAGGVVTSDMSRQIGVFVVSSKNSAFARTIAGYDIVQEVGNDFSEKHFPNYGQLVQNGQLHLVNPAGDGNAPAGYDTLEDQQWGMAMIHAREAQTKQSGKLAVRVGVVDSGIDGNHVDFKDANGNSNVDCADGADFTADGPGVGNPVACVDNNFHGTHVAGIIGARRNGVGVVGVAPNVTLIPIKVCDANGNCYVSDVVQGLTYAGDLKVNVINMSFFVDDDALNQSTEFKCQSDATQKSYIDAVERALHYARSQGVSLVSAIGNSDQNLAKPPGGKGCKTIPAMSPGVSATVALGQSSEKAFYSSWGATWADISAPGGDDQVGAGCDNEILSTVPGGWACLQGTSMASPHTTGVAALIISQFGTRKGGRIVMSPKAVQNHLYNTTVDIGAKGRDKCYGYGRIDALRAVKNDTSHAYDKTAPPCTEPD